MSRRSERGWDGERGEQLKGAALSSLSAALFGLLGFLATLGRAHGFSAPALLVFRFGLAGLDRFLLVFWVCLFSSLSQLIFSLATGSFQVRPDPLGILAVAAMALFSTVFALVAFAEGVGRIGPTAASILSTFEPVVTMIIGTAVLGEGISPSFALGAALILCSSVIVVLPRRST